MDDPLRPKAVPLSSDIVLWFEFLLDPELITKHLSKPRPEPAPIELMTQFISMAPDAVVPPLYELNPSDCENMQSGIPLTPGAGGVPQLIGGAADGLRISRKQMALKVLALKVATWLKWNLDMIERSLTIPKQLFLLRDLCTVSFGKLVSIPLAQDFQPKISPDGNENAARFALTFYHRWVLRLQILKDIAMKSARTTMGSMFVPIEPMHQFFAPEISPQTSIEYLQELCRSTESFYVFTYETFQPLHPDADNTRQNFHAMKQISLAELRAQISFDLVNFYLYTKQYLLARDTAVECRKNVEETKREYQMQGKANQDYLFCHFKEEELEGYLMACGVSAKAITLLERFNLAQLTQFHDIVEILKQDNRFREIPFANRRMVELDIEGAISHGVLIAPRTLEMHVAALNVVRSVFEEGNIFASVDYFDKYRSFPCFALLIECVVDVLPFCSASQMNALKSFLVDCVCSHKQTSGAEFLQQLQTAEIFSPFELEDLERQIAEEELLIPSLAALNEWKFNSKLPRIEIGSMERQLISCTNATTVRKLLVKLAATNPTKPLWAVNPSWELATPIKTLLMSMQRGFVQDFAYVLLGKARELTAKSDYIGAVSMLSVLKSETQRPELSSNTIVLKLGKLVNWEILLIQITQCLDEWHRRTLDMQSLINRCKQCLNSVQNGDSIMPRIEIVESCAIMLLNLNDWNSITFLDKRLPQLELIIAFANTFLDMEKMKGPKKICRDAWDIVLSMFLNTTKRGGAGSQGRNSPSLPVTTNLQTFLKRVRQQMLFSLVISLLGKIHNILKDDPNYDLNVEYMQLWPTSISNPISYSVRTVSETLHWLLTEALIYYPQTIAWLKMKGDLELAINNNEAAMRCYVDALVTGTEYGTVPLQRNVADDNIIRKMIRCSSNLGCHMQATVLCQFLDEIDYGIVFKNLTEKCSNFTDAMDAYYNCIWDTTLLEFIINLHAKKGEHNRKLEAMTVMNCFELNANNNDEIKREAVAIRKTRFLRALAKQYLL